jgi:uncharacterized protein YbaR (Trm112 family)
MIDKKLLEILACPLCKQPVQYFEQQQEFICRFDRLAFPIKEGIPVMLQEEARQLSLDEI